MQLDKSDNNESDNEFGFKISDENIKLYWIDILKTEIIKKILDLNTRIKKGTLRSLSDFWKPLLIQGSHSPECYNS